MPFKLFLMPPRLDSAPLPHIPEVSISMPRPTILEKFTENEFDACERAHQCAWKPRNVKPVWKHIIFFAAEDLNMKVGSRSLVIRNLRAPNCKFFRIGP